MVTQSEPLRPVIDIIEDISGHRPHPGTVSRWCMKGVMGDASPVCGLPAASVDTFASS